MLRRKRDEVVRIGDDIEILIVDVQGGYVRLGITAPHNVSVHRGEIYDAIKENKPRDQDQGEKS